ncbi:TNT domain-containing protein [Mycolicibacter minnesotensis]
MIVELNGSRRGGWLYGEGTSYAQRSLPPNLVIREFSKYELTGTVFPDGWRIEQFVVAPWFGQPGGGTGFRLLDQNGHTGPLQRLIDSGTFTPVRVETVEGIPSPPRPVGALNVGLGEFPEPCRPIVRAWYQWRIIATNGRRPYADENSFPWPNTDPASLLSASEVEWGEQEPAVSEPGVLTFSLGGIEFGFFLNADDKWVIQQHDRNTPRTDWGFLLLEDAQKFLLALIAEEARTLRRLPNIATGWYRSSPDVGIELVRYSQDGVKGAVFVRPAGSNSQYLARMDAWEAARFAPAFGLGYDELHAVLCQGITSEWFAEID